MISHTLKLSVHGILFYLIVILLILITSSFSRFQEEEHIVENLLLTVFFFFNSNQSLLLIYWFLGVSQFSSPLTTNKSKSQLIELKQLMTSVKDKFFREYELKFQLNVFSQNSGLHIDMSQSFNELMDSLLNYRSNSELHLSFALKIRRLRQNKNLNLKQFFRNVESKGGFTCLLYRCLNLYK